MSKPKIEGDIWQFDKSDRWHWNLWGERRAPLDRVQTGGSEDTYREARAARKAARPRVMAALSVLRGEATPMEAWLADQSQRFACPSPSRACPGAGEAECRACWLAAARKATSA